MGAKGPIWIDLAIEKCRKRLDLLVVGCCGAGFALPENALGNQLTKHSTP